MVEKVAPRTSFLNPLPSTGLEGRGLLAFVCEPLRSIGAPGMATHLEA